MVHLFKSHYSEFSKPNIKVTKSYLSLTIIIVTKSYIKLSVIFLQIVTKIK